MTTTTLSPKDQFIAEMKALCVKLDAIDMQTPLGETETDWWAEMSEIKHKAALIANNQNAPKF